MSPSPELKDSSIEQFNFTQQANFLQNIGNAVIAHRAIDFWAYQLEAYRRSAATLFFVGLNYIRLFAKVVAGFSLLAVALLRADPAAFSYQERPTFLVLVRYSISALYGGEIDAVKSGSTLSDLLAISAFGVGFVVLGSLLLSSALSFRATRDRSEIQDTIEEIRRQGDLLDQRVRVDYEVTIAEAEERLAELQWAMMGLIRFFSSRIPRPPDVSDRFRTGPPDPSAADDAP